MCGATVNTGTVSASTPAFSNLLHTYGLYVSGTYASGKYYPLEGSQRGTTPGFTFATPLQLNGDTTVGITIEYEGTTNGSTYNAASNLTSLISYGVAPTAGSDQFNGYYRNANSRDQRKFYVDPSKLRITPTRLYLSASSAISIPGPDQWSSTSGGNWNSSSNWSTSAVPTSATDASFNLSSTNYTVTVPSSLACKDLFVQADDVTLDLSGLNSSLSITGGLTVGQPATAGANAFGVLNLTHSYGGASANVSAATLAVGGNGGSGQLTVSSGITLAIAGTAAVNAKSSLIIAPGGKLGASNISIAGTTDSWVGPS